MWHVDRICAVGGSRRIVVGRVGSSGSGFALLGWAEFPGECSAQFVVRSGPIVLTGLDKSSPHMHQYTQHIHRLPHTIQPVNFAFGGMHVRPNRSTNTRTQIATHSGKFLTLCVCFSSLCCVWMCICAMCVSKCCQSCWCCCSASATVFCFLVGLRIWRLTMKYINPTSPCRAGMLRVVLLSSWSLANSYAVVLIFRSNGTHRALFGT